MLCKRPFKLVIDFVLLSFSLAPAFCQANAAWKIEMVTHLEGNASFSALAIDRLGNLHLAYTDHKGRELKYGFKAADTSKWDIALVDSTGAAYPSIAVDAGGRAHIVYNSPNVSGLHYAAWDGKQWQKSLIDPAKTGHRTSIQVDSKGNLRLAYYREDFSDRRSARNLKYAWFDGTTWYIQTADHRYGTGKWNSIGLDHHDNPFVSYSISGPPGRLGLAYLKESAWQQTVIDPGSTNSKNSFPSASSLTLDVANEPKIAYVDSGTRAVNYLWRQDGAWHQELIDSVISAGSDFEQVSLQLDQSGNPRVAYSDPGTGSLKYGARSDGAWHAEIVDDDGAGEFATLCLDRAGRAYILYSTPITRQLRIAHRLDTQVMRATK